MIPTQTFDSYPEFANSGTKQKPEDAKYSAGFIPSDVLPAEYLNWFLNGATKGVTALENGVTEIEREINNILASVSASADPTDHDQVVTAIISLIENRTGVLSNLSTTEKANLVAAINELVSTTSTLDTASTYKAGSASGELPINGSALGTTDNNIVVTDTNGKLKPSGTVIGSAAGKTAGSANGNVPLNGAALGTTEYNVVTTDADGNLKPYGKTAPKLATYGIFIETDTTTLDVSTYTFSPTGLDGLSIAAGDVVKLTFKYALQSKYNNNGVTGITAVKLNIGGANGNIQSVQAGALTNVKSHQFAGGNYSSTYKYKVWDAYTTLELMWTGSAWLVMGNPVLCSYFSSNNGYSVYADGKIEQWGEFDCGSNQSNYRNSQNYMIIFSTTPTLQLTAGRKDDSTTYDASMQNFTNNNTSQFKFLIFSSNGATRYLNWYATGY